MAEEVMLRAKALFSNVADTPEELSFESGDVLTVLELDVAGAAGWWLCTLGGRTGIAPGNRLRPLPASVANTLTGRRLPPPPSRKQVWPDVRSAVLVVVLKLCCYHLQCSILLEFMLHLSFSGK